MAISIRWQNRLRFSAYGAVFCAALLLTGCESMPSLRGKPAIDEPAAQALMDDGRFKEAAVAYERLAKYERARRASFQLKTAAAWREEGNYANVQKTLRGIKRTTLSAEESVLYDLYDAEILLSRGDADGALNLLVANPKKLSPNLAASYHELRAKAFQARGDFADAAAERAVLNALLDPVEKAANEHELRDLLAKLSPDELRNLARATDRSNPLYAFLSASGLLTRESTGSSFADAVSAAPSLSRTSNLGDARRVSLRKIAILLPTTGAIAPAAKAVQDGIFAAYFADQDPNKPEIFLVDSGTTGASANAALEKAIAEGADQIIGPLQRDQVTAVFQNGGALMPTLALNFADAGVLPPKGSLQFALLPEEEAVSAAEHMFEKGLKRVSMLVPGDDFGKRAAEAFTNRFTSLGGTIDEKAFFAVAASDHSQAIRTAMGVTESQARIQMVRSILGVPFTAQPTRRYDLDGIFLAARPQQGRLLLPQLRAFDAEDLTIVATSHIYAGTPSAALDRDLNGVEFCDAPWMLDTDTGEGIVARRSISSLTSTIGAGGRLVAFGIDAYRAANYLAWMEANPGVGLAGATGVLSADQNGSVRRIPTWAVMQNGTPNLVR
jgi:uncharacterized protein